MTSREIAELTGKRHDNVMADIRVMLAELYGEEGLLKFQASYINSQNKEQPCFKLPKRESLILVSGYNVAMRAKIIDRWQELEAQIAKPALPDFNNPVLAARAWADEVEKRQLVEQEKKAIESQKVILEAKIESDAPKVEFADDVRIDKDGIYSVRQAAKIADTQESHFRAWLAENDMIFKNKDGTWEPYAEFIKKGWFKLKIENINRRTFRSASITSNGIVEIKFLMNCIKKAKADSEPKVQLQESLVL